VKDLGTLPGLSNKKERCDFAVKAIVAEGRDIATILWICADKKCKKHFAHSTPYRQTPEEKAKRQKEAEAEKKAEEREAKKLSDALQNLKWPLTGPQLTALFELALAMTGVDSWRVACQVRKLEGTAEIKDSKYKNWETALRKAQAKMSPLETVRLVFELVTTDQTFTYDEDLRKKVLKLIA